MLTSKFAIVTDVRRKPICSLQCLTTTDPIAVNWIYGRVVYPARCYFKITFVEKYCDRVEVPRMRFEAHTVGFEGD